MAIGRGQISAQIDGKLRGARSEKGETQKQLKTTKNHLKPLKTYLNHLKPVKSH